jgi:catechol 2,3-dioxygenase-like lactoylglutathione lyase family enzyme
VALDFPGNRRVERLTRFALTTQDVSRLSDFYERAVGARVISKMRVPTATVANLLQVRGAAHSVTLALGSGVLELCEFESIGRPYPADLLPTEPPFQHFAIVLTDMQGAYRRLNQIGGWTPISTAGPERLPESSGGVSAFKFRDPEGHPLELLSFAPGRVPSHWLTTVATDMTLGIDHSAVSVTDVRRSTAFYHGLGFITAAATTNRGIEQERLDGILDPTVEVVALTPREPTPHVELLGYRNAVGGSRPPLRCNDVAATRLIFESAADECESRDVILRDPDGHLIQIGPPSRSR